MKPTIHFRFLFLLEMEETKKFDTWSYLEVWNRPDGPTHPGPDGPIRPGPDRDRGPDRTGPDRTVDRTGPWTVPDRTVDRTMSYHGPVQR
jgi:hypothetical protein